MLIGKEKMKIIRAELQLATKSPTVHNYNSHAGFRFTFPFFFLKNTLFSFSACHQQPFNHIDGFPPFISLNSSICIVCFFSIIINVFLSFSPVSLKTFFSIISLVGPFFFFFLFFFFEKILENYLVS